MEPMGSYCSCMKEHQNSVGDFFDPSIWPACSLQQPYRKNRASVGGLGFRGLAGVDSGVSWGCIRRLYKGSWNG